MEKKIIFGLMILNIVVMTGSGVRLYLFHTPFCVEAECRGYGIDVESIRLWEEQEKQGYRGILDLAGWRVRKQEMVMGDATKRSQRACVLEVYGNMELVCPAEILAGTYGMIGRTDTCVLSGELAQALFGGVKVEGEKVWLLAGGETGKRESLFTVAGVIDQEGEWMLVPAKKGEIERLVVRFAERFQAKKRMKMLLEGQM